jgi:hypothetical protein
MTKKFNSGLYVNGYVRTLDAALDVVADERRSKQRWAKRKQAKWEAQTKSKPVTLPRFSWEQEQ